MDKVLFFLVSSCDNNCLQIVCPNLRAKIVKKNLQPGCIFAPFHVPEVRWFVAEIASSAVNHALRMLTPPRMLLATM